MDTQNTAHVHAWSHKHAIHARVKAVKGETFEQAHGLLVMAFVDCKVFHEGVNVYTYTYMHTHIHEYEAAFKSFA